jgi:uncharacterized coiled-coil protein SlyX
MSPRTNKEPRTRELRTDTAAAERIAELEAEVAFQADGLRELNEALANQQLELLALRREMRILGEQFRALRSAVAEHHPGEGINERPPHY